MGLFTEYSIDPQELPTYEFLMELVLQKTANNVGREQVEQLMSEIAYHESRGMPEAIQDSQHWGDDGFANLYTEADRFYEGPGRGLYQYELETLGGSGAGRTAMQRLFNIVGGKNLPAWASHYFEGGTSVQKDVDFSELNEDQQKILFLADKLQDNIDAYGKKNIEQIGILSNAEWWAAFHHKGQESNIAGFEKDAARYRKNK